MADLYCVDFPSNGSATRASVQHHNGVAEDIGSQVGGCGKVRDTNSPV